MYRAITWLALKRDISEDEDALARLAKETIFDLNNKGRGSTVLVDNKDVTIHLRRPEVEQKVSLVSRIVGVRSALVEQQRVMAKEGSIVMVGRDIGTVVLPDAEAKIFLVASVAERAQRRYEELKAQHQPVKYQQVLEDLKQRDQLDASRAHSPLKAATDAHILSTDGIGVEQVVDRILELIGDD